MPLLGCDRALLSGSHHRRIQFNHTLGCLLQDAEDEFGRPLVPSVEPWALLNKTSDIAWEQRAAGSPARDPRPYRATAVCRPGGGVSPPRPLRVPLPDFAQPGAGGGLQRQHSGESEFSWSEDPHRTSRGVSEDRSRGTSTLHKSSVHSVVAGHR